MTNFRYVPVKTLKTLTGISSTISFLNQSKFYMIKSMGADVGA